jgi:hypothetical protein
MLAASFTFSNTLLLTLFLHALLIPSDIHFAGWVLSVVWSLIVLLIIPRLSYAIDHLRINREVSAGIILLIAIFVALCFALIERSIFYILPTLHLQQAILFVLLTVLIGRVENVYEAQQLSSNWKRVLFTVLSVSGILYGVHSLTHVLLPYLVEQAVVDRRAWSFWQGSQGRVLMMIVVYVLYMQLLRVVFGLKGGSK